VEDLHTAPPPANARGMNVPQPKDWIMAIAPYIPGRATTDGGAPVAKLSSNENPLGTSQAAMTAFAAQGADLSRYPDASAEDLRAAIAAHHDLDPARVIYGTGSDELLHLAVGAYAGPGDEVIYVRYGFAVYDIAIRRVGATPVVAPDADYATDVDALFACITDRTSLVFVANPNNPTGTFADKAEIARLHAGLPPHVMLVLDQAYAEYLTPEDVTRTFSKIHGLAAERVGWGYGSAEAVAAMHRIRAPFCCTTAGQQAAIAALGATDFVAHSRSHNDQWRDWFAGEIAKLGNAGLRAVPSRANFLLVLFEGKVSAEQAYKALMARGFIVRWLPGQGLGHGLRMTIGTEEETRGLAAALREIVAG